MTRVEVSYEPGHWGHWVVSIDGRPQAFQDTRAEAVDLGRTTARAQRPSELIIRYRRGQVYRVHRYPSPRTTKRERNEEMWRRLREGGEAG